MIKLTHILKELLTELEVSSTGQLQQNSDISSILKQLIVQDLGEYIGFDKDEDENEWIFEWEWEDKPYKLLSNGIYFIVFIDNNPKTLHKLYQDAEDWHPAPYEFQNNFVENYFVLGVKDAYNGNMERINTMMNTGHTGTIDNLVMAKINNKDQLLYFFNI